MLDRLLMGAADDKQFVEDVFSTWLYTGNGSTQTITNGIDLAGKGGLVWTKLRSAETTYWHSLCDTTRGAGNILATNDPSAQFSQPLNISGFTTTGFTVGNSFSNTSGYTFASWTFRKAPKFFDIVTYTGDGTSSRSIAHSLGIAPGFIVIKSTSGTSDWSAYHRSLSAGAGGYLNTTNLLNLSIGISADASTFSLTGTGRNASGTTYVVYLYAHDASADGLIQCGTYAGTGLAGQIATLGWEPQWVMIKAINTATDWDIYDNMRGMTTRSDGTARLRANTTGAESIMGGASSVFPTATGFGAGGGITGVNQSGGNYIYIAVRRGPMRTPTLGTSVFSPIISSTYDAVNTTGFRVDAQIWAMRGGTPRNSFVVDRLRGVGTGGTTNDGVTLSTAQNAGEVGTGDSTSRSWSIRASERPILEAACRKCFGHFNAPPASLM